MLTILSAVLFGYAGNIAVFFFLDLSLLFYGQLWLLFLFSFALVFFTCFSHFDLSLLITRSIILSDRAKSVMLIHIRILYINIFLVLVYMRLNLGGILIEKKTLTIHEGLLYINDKAA